MAQVQGKIVQCIGAVVDVEFPRDQMPKVYDALKMEGSPLTLEVQQQLGDGVVRTIALGSSDGLRRGMTVYNTGAPITVPVGKATLGRIMDVLWGTVGGAPMESAVLNAVAVLVIACPCALGLATPTAKKATCARSTRSC